MRHLLIALLAAAGCASGGEAKLRPQVQIGPGNHADAKKVLALSATCGSVEFECPAEYTAVVNGIVRSTMDFVGYTLVEPRTLRNETRDREETSETERVDSESASTSETERTLAPDERTTTASRSSTTTRRSTVVLTGPGFDDLSVAEREQVLTDAGADSVLTIRIVVGAQVGSWGPNQNVEVMIKLGVAGGDTMAWASRCIASSNRFETVNAALEAAARCAVFGGTGGE